MKATTSLVVLFKLLLIGGCASSALLAQETVGERFRKVLGSIDTECRQLKMGPYLDPDDPEYKSKRRGTDCDILKLEPRDWRTEKLVKTDGQHYPVPERWLATPEGRFAHSIKLPSPHDHPKVSLRPGTSGSEIFDTLCKEEAGEFVLRSASGVRGVRQDREWVPVPNGYSGLVFWTRESGGLGESPQDYLVQPPLGGYDFLELKAQAAGAKGGPKQFQMYYRNESPTRKRGFSATTMTGRIVTVPYIVAEKPLSQSEALYGYTWRGMWIGAAMEHGIEGYELIVYQINGPTVFGLQRAFLRHAPNTAQRNQRSTRAEWCPASNAMQFPYRFLQSVLIPANHREE